MSTLRQSLKTNRILAILCVIALGIALSFLHDVFQLILLPLGELARVTFIAKAEQQLIPTILVNISFQAIAFGLASALVLLLLVKLLDVKTIKYPAFLFLASQALGLWWLPFGFVYGFKPEMVSALPLLAISVVACALVYFALTYALICKRSAP